jgi:hypothetical protein
LFIQRSLDKQENQSEYSNFVSVYETKIRNSFTLVRLRRRAQAVRLARDGSKYVTLRQSQGSLTASAVAAT